MEPTEAINEILERLDGLAKSDNLAILITRAEVLGQRQAETLELLSKINGCLDAAREQVARHSEWIGVHGDVTHENLDAHLERLDGRVNISNIVSGAAVVICGALTALRDWLAVLLK